MQTTKLQSILFFTFLICAHISYTNSLKLKSRVNSVSQLMQNTTAPNTAKAAPLDIKKPSDLRKKNKQDIHDISANIDNYDPNNEIDPYLPHHDQYHIHHITPRNLTATNRKLSSRFERAHQRLDEIDDIRKENEERKILKTLPTKPQGIDSLGILNLKLQHISKQSLNFTLTDAANFFKAFNKAKSEKTKRVTVNGKTYVLKQLGNNFWYGAIVGGGGIAAYRRQEYVLIVTHNLNMSLNSFARYFQHLKHQFENHKSQLRVVYIKDKDNERTSILKKRLRNDKHLYDEIKQEY